MEQVRRLSTPRHGRNFPRFTSREYGSRRYPIQPDMRRCVVFNHVESPLNNHCEIALEEEVEKRNIKRRKKVARSLVAYGKGMDDWVRPTEKSRRFRPLAANSFLLGVLLDRNISADRAWDAGQWIAESMGDEADPSCLWSTLQSIEKRRLNGFMRYGYGGKSFHRHWKTLSDQLPIIAAIITEKYRGDPRQIWNNQRDIEKVRDRFEELPGIGPALSRMAVLILARNYGLLGGQNALAQLDIKPDVQVMRVFRRSGLVEREDDLDGAIQGARTLSPDFPASLDAPAWEIGRTWCKPRRPKCAECPIHSACPRIL